MVEDPDGVTWTLATANAAFPVRRDHRVAAFNGRMWLMAGSTGLYDETYLDVMCGRPRTGLPGAPKTPHPSAGAGK